jgi:hypothetical protein
MALIRVEGLPASPVAAAAEFYSRVAPLVEGTGDAALVLLFPPADHTHRSWRAAAVASLARGAVPRRINAIVSGDMAAPDSGAIAAALAYLEAAPGVTGQLLTLDSHGAGEVVG